MNIHESLMDEFRDEAKFKQLTPEQVESWLMGTFLFALVWSFGASTGNDARVAFDILVKEISKVRVDMHFTPCLHLYVCTIDNCTVYTVRAYVHLYYECPFHTYSTLVCVHTYVHMYVCICTNCTIACCTLLCTSLHESCILVLSLLHRVH